jgi:sensor histidine kinase regulating citrate/malate metabolism
MNIFTNKQFEPFIWFVYGAVIVTALCGILYVSMQQSFRQNLNDPQVQIAEDIAAKLEASGAIYDQIPAEKVSIDTSLTPFVIIYDTEGKPIVGNGYLQKSLMQTPFGVFQNAKSWGENRRTLEPAPGVRIASVVVPFVGREANGFVLVGRNMREIETRIEDAGLQIFVAWVVTLGTLFLLSCVLWFLRKN